MNFLAHFHLAWPNEMNVVGGLEGDYFKGPLPGALPPLLLTGVQLHRAIDAYTDSHPTVDALRSDFPKPLRRYAGILIDLCFDHCLAREWSRYHDADLAAFSQEVYGLLSQHRHLLSERAAAMAGWLSEHDVLGRYQQWDTIGASATRIGQRLQRDNPLHEAGALLQPMLPELEQGFEVFYPELTRFAQEYVTAN